MKKCKRLIFVISLVILISLAIIPVCNAESYHINVSNGSKPAVSTTALSNNWTWSSSRINYDTELTIRMVDMLQDTISSVVVNVQNVSIAWTTTSGSESYPVFSVSCRVPKSYQLTAVTDSGGDSYIYTYAGNNYDVPSELYIVGKQSGAKELVCRFYMPYYINSGDSYTEVLKHNAPIAYFCAQSGYDPDFWDIGYMIDLKLMWDYVTLNKGRYMLKGNIPLADGSVISTFDMETLDTCISPIINFAYDIWTPADTWTSHKASLLNSQFHSYFLPNDTDVTMYSNFNFYIPAEDRLTDELLAKILAGEIGVTDSVSGLILLTQEELEALKAKYLVPEYPVVDIDKLSDVFNWQSFMVVFNKFWNSYQSVAFVSAVTALFFSFVTIILILKVRR